MTQQQIDKYMKDIRKSLIERYGKIRPAIEPMLHFYEDALIRYMDMQNAYVEGNHTGVLLKSIKETVSILVSISANLGVSSPLDLARLKKVESYKEEEPEEKDYLDSL